MYIHTCIYIYRYMAHVLVDGIRIQFSHGAESEDDNNDINDNNDSNNNDNDNNDNKNNNNYNDDNNKHKIRHHEVRYLTDICFESQKKRKINKQHSQSKNESSGVSLCTAGMNCCVRFFWLGLCVLRRTYRQDYETLLHVVILSKHHHHHHHQLWIPSMRRSPIPMALSGYSTQGHIYIYTYIYIRIRLHFKYAN
jgi:hypothetical protein